MSIDREQRSIENVSRSIDREQLSIHHRSFSIQKEQLSIEKEQLPIEFCSLSIQKVQPTIVSCFFTTFRERRSFLRRGITRLSRAGRIQRTRREIDPRRFAGPRPPGWGRARRRPSSQAHLSFTSGPHPPSSPRSPSVRSFDSERAPRASSRGRRRSSRRARAVRAPRPEDLRAPARRGR